MTTHESLVHSLTCDCPSPIPSYPNPAFQGSALPTRTWLLPCVKCERTSTAAWFRLNRLAWTICTRRPKKSRRGSKRCLCSKSLPTKRLSRRRRVAQRLLMPSRVYIVTLSILETRRDVSPMPLHVGRKERFQNFGLTNYTCTPKRGLQYRKGFIHIYIYIFIHLVVTTGTLEIKILRLVIRFKFWVTLLLLDSDLYDRLEYTHVLAKCLPSATLVGFRAAIGSLY